MVARTGERWMEAELYRLKGELVCVASPTDCAGAELLFRQALDIARSRGERSLELRAAMSLARFWQARRRSDEARRVVADVYGRFTEGFDSSDLREAKGLLHQVPA
jgi:predicted ATPase